MRAVSDWFFGILRLSLWEWFKLRRRWMPWLLLAFLVLFPQIGAVSSYFIYRGDISGDSFQGDVVYGIETTDAEGRAVEVMFGCDDFQNGGMPQSVAALTPEDRAVVMADIEDYRITVCEDESGLLESESRNFFVMPASIANGLSAAAFMGIVLTMVLAASVMGTEYSWGTLRTSLVSGVSRRKFLASKVVTLLSVAAGGLLVTALALVLTSLLFTFLTRHVGGGWADTGDWATVFVMFGKVFFGIVPYLMLAVFIAVLTSSTGMGIGVAMGYYMIEAIVTGLLVSSFDWFEPVSNFILGPNVAAWLSHDDVIQVTLGIRADGDLGTMHYFSVILAYTAALGAAAFWRFERKDVTGAKGD